MELAQEIVDYWKQRGQGRPLTVCLPGGTCSTAVLVHKALNELEHGLDIRVVVVPCVGDDTYAHRQMQSLYTSLFPSGSLGDALPTVLPPAPDTSYFGQSTSKPLRYYTFGEPHEDILATFNEMEEEYGLALDLIYGAPSWTLLLRHFRTEADGSGFDPSAPLAGREIMYVHSGGLEGVNSQLMRYKYKGLVEDVQLPGRIKKK